MVEVKLSVRNEDIVPVIRRLKLFRAVLADEMIASSDANPKVRAATTSFVIVGDIIGQLTSHKDKYKIKYRG